MLIRIIVLCTIILCPSICWGEVSLGKVAIDPGHGGYDPGAIRQGIMEKQINLEIAFEVEKILKQNNVDVILTRYGDYNHAVPGLRKKEAKRYDFERRIDFARNFDADIMVSIHCNVGRRRCMGPETFYYGKSVQGKLLAEQIQRELHKIPGIGKRSYKPGSYYILTRTSMPCVIIEMGFINNPKERKLLMGQEYRHVLAKATADGIIEYLKIKRNSETETKSLQNTNYQ
ncbi:N-acetylmuramoyl-L-alanine amidase family protein [Desulforamulus aquiferis]|uniref:N-acetylmuramoyl-L-alanine amidase n=1 Tax=Desulforamulus aquiferis TaxID=1397668 RepID=A0AAW7ZEF9_9FIRM|nr:N-acetylmuramoyl-L-alanine amidase [Desulforamulus aquiferis]MDO7787663.1 N-acetylmuramoyl-L-alanine amidase [Desulforamulus aquiferis]